MAPYLGLCTALLCATANARLLPVHLQKPTSTESVLVMKGNLLPMGVYATTIGVGTPPVPFQVTLDTGSTDMLIPVKGCKGCAAGAPTFNPDASSTSSVVACKGTSDVKCKSCADGHLDQCGFKDSYLTCDLSNETATCTVSGGVYHDVIHLSEKLSAPWAFGGITFQTTNFDQFKKIDGIFGLAFQKLGFSDSPMEGVVRKGAIDDVVQTCLTREGGLLVFGRDASDAKYYHGDLQWTPILEKSWYVVWFNDLFVNEKNSGVHGVLLNGPTDEPCIVDSGTNFLSLTADAFNATRRLFQSSCQHGKDLPGICGKGPALFEGHSVQLTPSEINEFPTVTIEMRGNVSLSVSGNEYLIPKPGHEGEYVMGIIQGDCIIGDVHMIKYWVAYDRANMRIGFAPLKAGACAATAKELLATPWLGNGEASVVVV